MSTEGQPSIIQIQTGNEKPRNWRGAETKYKSFSRELDCGEFTFEVVFQRSDNFRDFGTDFYHLNWLDPYVQNPAKTLLVANTGMHTPDQEQYQYDLDQFVETVQALDRPQDMIVFRTSVPGHENCKDHQQPLASSSDYHPTLYQWGSIFGYNQYTKQKLSNLGSSWLFLDVYPMTILRGDGHKHPNRDCLHYHLPGPPDWWNHLLYSNLLDLATVGGDDKKDSVSALT